MNQSTKIIRVLEDDVIEKDLLDEEVIFIEKLVVFTWKRAMKFKEIALDMSLVTYP